MKTTTLGLVLLTAIFLIAATPLERNVDEIESWTIAPADPILVVGHGAIFDANGKKVDPSPEFVIQAQRFYIKTLYDRANEQLRQKFNARHRTRDFKPDNQAEQILLNSTMIAWLIEATEHRDGTDLVSKNTALLSRFVDTADATKDAGAGRIRKELLDYLVRDGSLKFLAATQAGGDAYITACRQAGVPIPPDWGSNKWQSRGPLTIDFLGSTPTAELFSFESESPRGVCFALPRSSGNSIPLLGIICLGTDTSKSCFWDNDHRPGSTMIHKGDTVRLSDFLGGADLNLPGQIGTGGKCTDCHAGENPYIVHPGQPMDLGNKIIPKNWHEPLVHPSWPQNSGPTNVLKGIALNSGEGSCLACHTKPPGRRFPEVSTEVPGYCGVILPSAFSQTMPPGDIGSPKYNKHFNALQAACKQPPSGGVVINGAIQSDPTSSRSDTTIPLSSCTGGPDCPIGFCYWRTLHGPFWQTSSSDIAVGDAKYRGSFARIYVEGNKWMARVLVDPSNGPPQPPPGGTAECTNYDQIATVPDPNLCFAKMFTIFDPDGKKTSQSVNASVTGTKSANILSGVIGNVAQAPQDTLRVFENGGRIELAQVHTATPPSPLRPGPMTGESWTNGCNAWTPIYEAKDVLSTSDVQLVPPGQANKARCYITGVTGAWSRASENGTVQPFAEIYKGSSGDLRLRVSPVSGNDLVGAYASCIRLK
jgi:hypothetical protein